MGTCVLLLALAAAPTRVTDDNGCTKGIDSNNELDGEIVCRYPDGRKRYEGSYAHGKRVGVAKTWWEDGKLAKVDRFVSGQRDGLCEQYRRDGTPEEACEYQADQKHGACKTYGPGGVLREEARYVRGDKRGPFVGYWPNGKVRERGSTDEQGRRDGLYERLREDGTPEDATEYRQGRREGLAREWHPGGKPRSETTFKGDLPHGLSKRFHENGQLSEQSCYQNGSSTLGLGPCTGQTGTEVLTRFYPDGTPFETLTVRDGKKSGERKQFERGGTVRVSELYADDRLDGPQRVFKGGKLERLVTWRAGKKHGLETVYFDDGKRSEETTWVEDRRTGFTTWWMNGKKKRAELADGELWRRSTWYDNGQQESEDAVRAFGDAWSEKREGGEKQWTEAGVLTLAASWRAGKRHGEQKAFYPDTGQALFVEEWADGVRLSRKEWNEKGSVVRDERYNADGSRK